MLFSSEVRLLGWVMQLACVGGAHRSPEVGAAPVEAAEAAPVEVAQAEPVPPPEPVPDLVEVAVPREFRGMWVATVSNLDFPSRRGLSPDEAKAELEHIAETAQQRGLNALVFQVRPEGDALYASSLEPWSRFLTGEQGKDPGFDPLASIIEQAHARGIEVHAWFNPYRAAAAKGSPTAEQHVTRWAGEAVCPWDKVVWLDPGAQKVREHTLAVIDDVLTRYEIDGVHLDDYFYPYPHSDGKTAFPDQASYQAYCDGGGTLERDAWRRHNVDTMVEQIALKVAERRPDCRFGISPFGIYRPGIPEGIRGMDQVDVLHADPLAWHKQGWVDYLAPQLYWPTSKEAQRYDKLLSWWNEQVSPERPLLVGLDLMKVGKEPAWTLQEVRTQVELSRKADRTVGQIWFRASAVLTNQGGVADVLSELYASPALPPPTPGFQGPAAPPKVHLGPAGVSIEEPEPGSVRAYVLYKVEGAGPQVDRILPPATSSLALEPGTWAISAVRRGAVESLGVRFVVPSPT
jgi:uncharacterized lipoprotein YddW (UPF0748 family)